MKMMSDYDFSKAKTLVLFCNGPWCSQSPDMIFALLEIGYPPEKLKLVPWRYARLVGCWDDQYP